MDSWRRSKKILPIGKVPRLLVFVCPILPQKVDDQNYEWIVVGHEGKSYCWIMARKPVMDDSLYGSLTQRLVDKHGCDLERTRKVPQKWTRDERAKHKLASVIADEFLER